MLVNHCSMLVGAARGTELQPPLVVIHESLTALLVWTCRVSSPVQEESSRQLLMLSKLTPNCSFEMESDLHFKSFIQIQRRLWSESFPSRASSDWSAQTNADSDWISAWASTSASYGAQCIPESIRKISGKQRSDPNVTLLVHFPSFLFCIFLYVS